VSGARPRTVGYSKGGQGGQCGGDLIYERNRKSSQFLSTAKFPRQTATSRQDSSKMVRLYLRMPRPLKNLDEVKTIFSHFERYGRLKEFMLHRVRAFCEDSALILLGFFHSRKELDREFDFCR
jgi:hypothetical protein